MLENENVFGSSILKQLNSYESNAGNPRKQQKEVENIFWDAFKSGPIFEKVFGKI